MTREEANKLIMKACERTWNEKTCKEIFKALEQESCDDAISRQAVLDVINTAWTIDDLDNLTNAMLTDMIKTLRFRS